MEDPGQLYVRMNHFSTDPALGVKTPFSTKLVAMLNPTTLRHLNISVKCSDGVNKNWPLGHGQYTCSGNIGPLMPTVIDAKNNGFSDVLWLLDDFVQEMTVYNVFFVVKNRYGTLKLYTPMDNGCIVSGVTRQSIIDLKDKIQAESGMHLAEKNISIHEILQAYQEDRLLEVIGVSTSSHIQPVNRIVYKGQTIKLNTNKDSKYVSYLNNLITNIMTGPDNHPWVSSLKV
jgi:branched-chain amino acid aminotransferase